MKAILPLLLMMIPLAACAGPAETGYPGPEPPGAAYPAAFPIRSGAFAEGEAIPKTYSCQGEDRSPALEWDTPPAGTQSLALLMDDSDAPGGTWTHWIVYNLPASTTGLPEGASSAKGGGQLPAGAVQGKNSFRRVDYGGPCPPSGKHRYFFKLYALDTSLPAGPLDRNGLLKAMQGHILAQGELMGTYQK